MAMIVGQHNQYNKWRRFINADGLVSTGKNLIGMATNIGKTNIDVNFRKKGIETTGSIQIKHGEISLGNTTSLLNISNTFSWKSVESNSEVFVTIDINKLETAIIFLLPEFVGVDLRGSQQLQLAY